MLAPRRRRSRRARCRGRSRSARGAAAPASPGRSPASSRASWPATSPNWLNRSSWRAVFGGIHASGSKSSTWAATWLRNGDGSNRSIRLIGERPARSPARNGVDAGPDRGDHADAGDPDVAAVAHVGGFVGSGSADVAASDTSASAIAPNVASVRPAIGRVNSRSMQPAQPGTRGAEVVVDLDPAAGDRGRSSIRHVTSMPFVAPPRWRNRRRRASGSRPGQRLPGDRQRRARAPARAAGGR